MTLGAPMDIAFEGLEQVERLGSRRRSADRCDECGRQYMPGFVRPHAVDGLGDMRICEACVRAFRKSGLQARRIYGRKLQRKRGRN